MRFSTKILFFSLLLVCTRAQSAGWSIPEESRYGDWSDYSEASPDIYPDGWSVAALAKTGGLEVQLRSSDGAMLRWIDMEQINTLYKVHRQIQRAAETQANLYITRGDTPNASAGLREGINTVFINFAMFDMINGDPDLWVALIGHEIAHLTLKHGETQAKKKVPLNILKTVGSAVLNNPLTNMASSTLLDSVGAKFSRDDERQADYMGVIWAIQTKHDAHAAVELHRRLGEQGKSHPLPFLSSHPSSPERMENLEVLADRLSK